MFNFDYSYSWSGIGGANDGGLRFVGSQRGAPEYLKIEQTPDGSGHALALKSEARTSEWRSEHGISDDGNQYSRSDREVQDDLFALPYGFKHSIGDLPAVHASIYIPFSGKIYSSIGFRIPTVPKNYSTPHYPAVWAVVRGDKSLSFKLRSGASADDTYMSRWGFNELSELGFSQQGGWITLGLSYDKDGYIHYYGAVGKAVDFGVDNYH